jgi:hypothetical protein|tara:strand:- start:126 stop:458 length:333 start_codon:yes stop_codon:yes gene_type:complete
MGGGGAQRKHRMQPQKLAERLLLLAVRFVGVNLAVRLQEGEATIVVEESRCWGCTEWGAHAAATIGGVGVTFGGLFALARALCINGNNIVGLGGGSGRSTARRVLRSVGH